MKGHMAYLRIKRAVESNKECFLCALEDELERKYIDTYLYELVMDPKSREQIIKSRGFCNNHSYKMFMAASKPESSDGHGLALVLTSVTEKFIGDLRGQGKLSSGHTGQVVPNITTCPACLHLSYFMETYTTLIVEFLASGHEDFSKLLKSSKGFCIPHFVALLQMAEKAPSDKFPAIVETIIKVEEKNLGRLNSELGEYVRRQSYEFSDKDRAACGDVVLRGVEKVAGRRGIILLNDGVNSSKGFGRWRIRLVSGLRPK